MSTIYKHVGVMHGYSNQGYNEEGYPKASYPQQPYHPSTYPRQTFPDSNHPRGYPSTAPTMSGTYAVPGGEDPSTVFDFTEKSIRLGFIRKVYSILTIQLLITVGFIALFIFSEKVQKYFAVHNEYLLIALVVVIVLAIVLSCCSSVRRSSPSNFICLVIFTLAMSFLVGVVSAAYDTQAVILAASMTAAITLGLTMFAFQTKMDFTAWGGALFGLVIVLLIGGIFAAIFPSKIGEVLIASFGAILMSLYIIYDTQLMIGGKHTYSISPEEYIFASLNLYLDIINLFLYLLRLIGSRD